MAKIKHFFRKEDIYEECDDRGLSNCDKSKMISTVCDNCKGSGIIRISSFAKDAIPCPACKGTGMQEIVRM